MTIPGTGTGPPNAMPGDSCASVNFVVDGQMEYAGTVRN